jgi:hypothetical protein
LVLFQEKQCGGKDQEDFPESKVPFLSSEKLSDVKIVKGTGKDESLHPPGASENAKKGRYIGLIYTLLSTNCFSLSSTVLKKHSHIHPFNLGTWAFPVSALLSVPFIIYTVYVQKQSVTHTFWPIGKHKKTAFIMWVS